MPDLPGHCNYRCDASNRALPWADLFEPFRLQTPAFGPPEAQVGSYGFESCKTHAGCTLSGIESTTGICGGERLHRPVLLDAEKDAGTKCSAKGSEMPVQHQVHAVLQCGEILAPAVPHLLPHVFQIELRVFAQCYGHSRHEDLLRPRGVVVETGRVRESIGETSADYADGHRFGRRSLKSAGICDICVGVPPLGPRADAAI